MIKSCSPRAALRAASDVRAVAATADGRRSPPPPPPPGADDADERVREGMTNEGFLAQLRELEYHAAALRLIRAVEGAG